MTIAPPFKKTKKQERSLQDRRSDNSPFKERSLQDNPIKKEGSLQDRNDDSFPLQKKEGPLQNRNGDRSPLQKKKQKGLFKIDMAIAPPSKKRRVSSR